MRTIGGILFFAALLYGQHEGAQPGGEDDAGAVADRYIGNRQAIAAGRELYLSVCSGCHGATGEGGRGPNLLESRNVRRADDKELFNSIRNGIPGSDMPPSPLPDESIWQLSAYVRNLSAPAYEQNVEGDAEAGKELFYGKAGCTKCHMIRGQGGFLGPDLSNIGITSNITLLRESLLDPNRRFTEGYTPAIVTTKDGKKIEGVAKNNSNYSLQFLDRDGELHLFNKRDLKEVFFREKSWMPADYEARLSQAEIQNLLAFLSKQTVRTPTKRSRRQREEQ